MMISEDFSELRDYKCKKLIMRHFWKMNKGMLDYGPSQSWGHASACKTSGFWIFQDKNQNFEDIEVFFLLFHACFFLLLAMHFFAFHAVTCLFLMLLNFDDIFAGCHAAVLGRGSHFSSVGYSALNNPQSILKIAISCLQQFSLKPCPAWHNFYDHFQSAHRHQMYQINAHL